MTNLTAKQMTKEEFMSKIDDLEKRQEGILQELNALQEEYIASLGFKQGDRVRVTKSIWSFEGTQTKTIDCFIGNIRIARFSNHNIDYDFRAIKKDGTMAKTSAGIYSHHDIKIEKINP